MMRKFISLAMALCLVGCGSIEVASGKVYRVTGGYDPARSAFIDGDEFLFSLVPPKGKWAYIRSKPWTRLNDGRLEFTSEAGSSIGFSWMWDSDIQLESNLKSRPHLAPWLYGSDPKMERVPYVPTAQQIKSGDWDQPGYSQRQWHHFRYLGMKQYYCLTTLIKRREGMIQWGDTRQEPYNAYSYIISCPFRLTDGRHSSFIVRTGFSMSDEQLLNDPSRVDRNVEIIDALLEPTWNSLEIMPAAYQFRPPGASSSAELEYVDG